MRLLIEIQGIVEFNAMAFTNFHWYLESIKYLYIKIMEISNALLFISLGIEFKGYKPKYIEIIHFGRSLRNIRQSFQGIWKYQIPPTYWWSWLIFFLYVKTNLSTHGGFEPVTYRKECLNSAPIHRQSKAPWAMIVHVGKIDVLLFLDHSSVVRVYF